MKFTKFLAATALAASIASVAHANQVLHITGSTAFRAATVAAIENSMVGAYSVAYQGSSAVADLDERAATQLVIRGTLGTVPGVTTIKCAWTGSTGGILINAKQLDITSLPGVTGWMAESNLGSTASITVGNKTLNAVASPSVALDTAKFPGETQKPDVNMADSLQSSTPYSTPALVDTPVGVIVFEWVVNNGFISGQSLTGASTTNGSTTVTVASTAGLNVGSTIIGTGIPSGATVSSVTNATTFVISSIATATGSGLTLTVQNSVPITNITSQQAQAVFASGGVYLSQFTGVPTDATPVYGIGRNFDSGTRLSQLAESGLGVLAPIQQHQVTVSGTIGAGGTVTKLDQYVAETLFPAPYTQSFSVGQSGYSSGGTLADALATPGSSTAPSTTPARAPLFGDGGWLIGYLGRNDVNRAVKKTAGTNTAHRLTFNGVSDWTGSADSQVSVWNDNAVQEGSYPLWEIERLQRKAGLSANQILACTTIATRITNTDASLSGTKLSAMNVSKDVEGGLITHN